MGLRERERRERCQQIYSKPRVCVHAKGKEREGEREGEEGGNYSLAEHY